MAIFELKLPNDKYRETIRGVYKYTVILIIFQILVQLSKNGKTPRRAPVCEKKSERPNKFPISDDQVPVVPFFRSVRSQNTNEDVKQHRMETFTGTEDVTWQHKREVENLFKPTKDLTNINGAQLALGEDNRTERYNYSVTNKMDGVAPIAKEYVGRGLNAGTDIAAKGGFHDTYRILPENVNGYKKNNFGGRIIAGKGVTPQRDATVTLQDNQKPERYYTIADRHDLLAIKDCDR